MIMKPNSVDADCWKCFVFQVLWFAPAKSMSIQNFYGNISFVINWEEVLEKLGFHIYLIDQAVYKNKSFTRILLTNKNYFQLEELTNTVMNREGIAIKKTWGQYYHVLKCFNKETMGFHELQIGIETTDADARWLFQNCSAQANNHSNVNIRHSRPIVHPGSKPKNYVSYRCYKYNTAQNKDCPHPYSITETEELIDEMGLRSRQKESMRRVTRPTVAKKSVRKTFTYNTDDLSSQFASLTASPAYSNRPTVASAGNSSRIQSSPYREVDIFRTADTSKRSSQDDSCWKCTIL